MNKVRRSVTLSKEILDWLKEQIEQKRFGSISHGIEFCVHREMQREKQEIKS